MNDAGTTTEIKASSASIGIRADKWLLSCFEELSRSYIQKLIKEGHVLLDGAPCKSAVRLKGGEIISITFPPPEKSDIKPEEMNLDIIYEDDAILIINKPKGMVVHPAPGHLSGTLVNGIMWHCGERLSHINGIERPGVVHRIDRDTTGLLCICKTDSAHRSVAAQLKEHSVSRAYFAIISGHTKNESGTVNAPIARSRTNRMKMAIDNMAGRRAVTHYEVMEELHAASLIKCTLETGRTHQIRVHMAHIGHPIMGDPLYGGHKPPIQTNGQALHAGILGFIHPTTGKYMEWTAPYPAYFDRLLEILRK